MILLAHAAMAWLFERLFAAVLCRGELLLSHDLSSRRLSARALLRFRSMQASVLQDASTQVLSSTLGRPSSHPAEGPTETVEQTGTRMISYANPVEPRTERLRASQGAGGAGGFGRTCKGPSYGKPA